VRRTIVPLLLVAAAVAMMAAIPAASAAPSARLHPMIACPLVSPPGPVTCCGPPINGVNPGCCPATASPCCPPIASADGSQVAIACASSLTIRSSPDPSMEGAKVVISGRLLGTGGAAVTLWERPAGMSAFVQIGTTQTDANGAYSMTRDSGVVTTDRAWYATSGTATSETINQQVQALVTLAATRTSPRARQVLISGHVSPDHAGESVTLQILRGHAWTTLATPRLAAVSGFTLTRSISHRARLRLVFAGDSMNAASTSRIVTVAARRRA
jgi:hypothetical protein